MFIQPGNQKVKVPVIPYRKSSKGQGVVGPFGEVLTFKVDNEELPVYVSAPNGVAVMDFTDRSAVVRYGKGSSAIILTTAGVKFGSGKVQPWSAPVVHKLVSALAKNPALARSALLLRAALHNAYPVAVARAKSKMGKRMGASMAKGAPGFGVGVMDCVVTSVTSTVTTKVLQLIEVIKTAEKQFQDCYDTEVAKSPCKDTIFFAGPCAAAICAGKAFIDLVVGYVEVVTEVTEEVTREVVACAIPKVNIWPNPWNSATNVPTKVVPQPKLDFGKDEIDEAIELLKKFGDVLGPFGECMLASKWSLAQLNTQLNLGGDIVIPYGIKVCISSSCASKLALDQTFAQNSAAWGAALAVLAALSLEFAQLVAPLGIVAAPVVVTAAAALAPEVVAAAAIIFAFVLLVLIYATAISAQLTYHKHFTNNFADGKVCIEHPTFALALIKLASFTLIPAELIPPIVTG